eukprot:gene5707-8994_t
MNAVTIPLGVQWSQLPHVTSAGYDVFGAFIDFNYATQSARAVDADTIHASHLPRLVSETRTDSILLQLNQSSTAEVTIGTSFLCFKVGRHGPPNRRGQKHQNIVAFKAGKYGEPKRLKEARTASTTNVCPRCFEKIEWKKRYNKYKPRTTPGTCRLCQQKTVRLAYHIICKECAKENNLCAKCNCKNDDIIPDEPSEKELLQEQLEEQRYMQNMRERERRSYLRQQEPQAAQSSESEMPNDDGNDSEPADATHNMSLSREEGVKDDDDDDWEDIEEDDGLFEIPPLKAVPVNLLRK